MRIENNLSALFAQNNLQANNVNLSKSLEILSSGNRINRASDDAAGLQISSKMRAQVRSTDTQVRIAQNGIADIQIAEGSIDATQHILRRMHVLAVQSTAYAFNTEDRLALQKEMNQLVIEIDRVANETKFNNENLINGTAKFNIPQIVKTTIDSVPTFNVTTSSLGLTKDSTTSIDMQHFNERNNEEQVNTANFSQELVDQQGNIKYGIDITTESGASAAITLINNAIENVSMQRSTASALQNRVEYEMYFLGLGRSGENLLSNESRIKDVDIAREMMEFTKNNVLNESAQAMLAQANQSPYGVLQLLR